MDNYAYQDDNNGRPFAITRYPQPPNGQNDYLVEVNSRSKILKNPRFYKRTTIILLIIAFLLLIGLIVVLVLYCRTEKKVCSSDECLRSATNLKYSLDFSVDPCDNFYKFTCGKWSQEHPNHGWYNAFSTFSTISEKISIASKTFFQSTPLPNETRPLKLARNLYASCMDTGSLDRVGLSVVYKYLEKSKLPILPSFFTKSDEEQADFTFDWLKYEARIKKIFSMDVFFGFLVEANIYNRSENIIYLGNKGLSCPLPSPIKKKSKLRQTEVKSSDDEERENLVEVIKSKIIKFVIQQIAINSSLEIPSDSMLDEAVSIINNISDVIEQHARDYAVVGEVDFTPFSFQDLNNLTDEGLEGSPKKYPDIWNKYAEYLFEGANVTIDFNKDKLYTSDIEMVYLVKVLHFILNIPEIYLELYMWFSTVYAMIINTTSEIVEFIGRQTAPYYGVSEVVRTRSLDCSSLVNSYMGLAVSYAIADREFLSKTKPKVEKMINEIKNAFAQTVLNTDWMDRATKTETLEKSKQMLSFIGYPDWLFDEGKIEEVYKDIDIKPDTFLQNMINLIENDYPETLERLRVINERSWSTDPITVNAYNSFPDNAINVPIAMLNFPMYYLGLEVLNYGSIGSILGHELTHGFDDTGRKHDKFGNFIQWWPNKTIETFENKTQCFIDQYNNYTIEGIEEHVDGIKTLGENIADNGGFNQALLAYKNFARKHGEDAKLPGFEKFSNLQLFFIAYGSIWCETISLEDLKDQIMFDEHSPNSIRVLGTLQNSLDFANAFHCPKGSPMNPKRPKCKIW